ncbi:MAG TPA: ornithine cyclodeaminase family protein [Ktedonobacteraceae bacterium]|nr:ornithine cyclodeaminase family protein [Ktedonobacteraceae bacterium]
MIKHQDDRILYLASRDVQEVCKEIDSVAVIREVFKLHGSGQTILPDEAYLGWTNAKGESVRSLNMPAYVGGPFGMAGTKIINGNIANPARGLPRASGLTLLFDPVTVRVVCMMEGAYISSLRTASVTALSADLLKGREIQTLAIIGAGVLARAHIELLVMRLPGLRHIRLFDLEEQRIETLQQQVAFILKSRGVEMQATKTAEEAIRPAQLIVPVTTTTQGYISYDWLQPGSLLVNISLDDPLPEVVLRADKVIVDDWNLVKNDPRRLVGRMYRQGKVIGPDDSIEATASGRRRIDAQLGEIVTGAKAGRTNENEIILVNPFGLAIEDVALAIEVYRKARKMGMGVELER